MSRSWKQGSTRAWRETRARVLAANAAENKGLCTLDVGVYCPRHRRRCPNVCTRRATTVHHLDGKQAGDNPRRLAATCAACNQHVGNPQRYDPTPTPRSRW